MWVRSGDDAMPKVALYARYSTDNQSVVSIEDQFRICREHAGRERWQIVDTYHDAAISGASVILRPGVQSLLQDAQRAKFDIVLAEALDRVSRDQADVATLFKHLRFAGVQIVTLAEGEISELHVGLKGTMNALFLKDLPAKTHRGLRGRVEKGKAGGGLCYGYDVVKRTDSEGEPVRGERKINAAEAAIVCRIFREFAAGKSPRAATKAVTAGQGRLCQSRLIKVLGGLVHRDMTTHHGLSSNSFKCECSTQGTHAFAHSSQASTECGAIGKADAVINN